MRMHAASTKTDNATNQKLGNMYTYKHSTLWCFLPKVNKNHKFQMLK